MKQHIAYFTALTCGLFTMAISSLALAAQLIIEPDMGRNPIINEINSAKQSVQLVMYNLTDKEMLNSLLAQHKRGITVHVVLEKTPYRTTNINKKTIQKLKIANIDWRGKIPDIHFIHQKTLLIDHRKAVVMTFNFTKSAFKNQRNFALIIDEPSEVKDIEQHFVADWDEAKINTHSANLIWSPENSREKIISLIHSTKQQLHIYAESITDKGIIDALAIAANRGVKVTIVTSSKLFIPGVVVLKSLSYYIHAKVFIIDNQSAVIGSINLTKNSLNQNRELSVITHDQRVIKQLQATFAYDSGTLI